MQYNRYFVPLKQDNRGYECKGREPMGRCVLEARGNAGKLAVWVQDLKPEILYKVILLFSRPEGIVKAVPAGSLTVDAKARGEMKWEFDADNVGNSGFKLKDFGGVAVLAPGKAEVIAPLVGYRENSFSWKKSYQTEAASTAEVPAPSTTPQTPKPPATPEVPAPPCDPEIPSEIPPLEFPDDYPEELPLPSNDSPVIVPPDWIPSDETTAPHPTEAAKTEASKENYATDKDFFEGIGDAPDPAAEAVEGLSHEKFKHFAQQYKQSMESIEQIQFIPFPQPSELSDEEIVDKQIPEELDTLEQGALEKKNIQQDKLAEECEREPEECELDYIFRHNVSLTPFKRQNKPVKWVRVSLKEPVFLHIDYQKVFNSPFVISAYQQYKHLILGVIQDQGLRSYVLGVPCRYEPEYKVVAMKLGFNQFKCCDDVRPAQGLYGYWLMQI